MSMSRKDYVNIAKEVVTIKNATNEDAYVDFVHNLCVIFESDNDRFDSDKFKQATKIIA
jgi:hypothetical protein